MKILTSFIYKIAFYSILILFSTWFMGNLMLGCNNWSNEEVCITPEAFIEELF